MSHPRIAEVDEDEDDLDLAGDPDEMDVEAFDFARPQGALGQFTHSNSPAAPPSAAVPSPTPPLPGATLNDKERARLAAEQREKAKAYQCLYPCYFDSSRSRARGRRVSKEQAVANPLAREIAEAVQAVGTTLGVALKIVFEPNKQHPDDWANPGRVKVLVRKDGENVSSQIGGKHHLYTLVAAYMKNNPTTAESPMKLRLHGMPPMDGPPKPPAVPRGFRINEILPLHSPALSGGGVSDNMFNDMMAEMQGLAAGGAGAGALGAAGGAGGGGKKVKDKKKK